jgi:hypothetical protein
VTWTNVSSISGLDGTGSGKPSGGDGGLEEDRWDKKTTHRTSIQKKAPRCTMMMQRGAFAFIRNCIWGYHIRNLSTKEMLRFPRPLQYKKEIYEE